MKRSVKVIVTAMMLSLLSAIVCACGLLDNGSDDDNANNNKPVSYGMATVRYHYEYDVIIEHYHQDKYSVQIGKEYKITEPYTPPVKAGYRFVGYTMENGGAGDVVGFPFSIVSSGFGGTVYDFYAKFEPVEFTVVYHLDGGVNNPENPVLLVGKQTLKNPTKDRYNFIGWYRDPEFTSYTSTASMVDDVTTIVDLYAKWQRVYELNYISNQDGLKVVGDKSYWHYTEYTEDDSEMTIRLEPEYYKHYMFLGWELERGAELVDSAEIKIDPKQIKQDFTFTAHYLEASNPSNTKGLMVWIVYGRYEYYAREGVDRIIVSDKYGDKYNETTHQAIVYYSGETPPEVICREDITVEFVRDPEKVEEKF